MLLSPETLKNTWEDFSVYKKPLARADLIQHYSYLVKVTAGRLFAVPPVGSDKEDLISAGVIGLIKAVDHYDPTRDVKFETYAIALIRGAILEMVRQEDWVPRSIREKMRNLDRATCALENELGRLPSELEIAERMGIPTKEVSELMVRTTRTMVHSLDEVVGSSSGEGPKLIDLVVDEGTDTEDEVEAREVRRILVQCTDRLPERERLVVSLYYDRGLTFREIGGVLGVSEPRAYHLHTQAMNRLRTSMKEHGITQPC
ncbi:MAG: FliA/WhiG family RNA polymerase sigma factor [Fimbriimonas sp.]|nr:FliA/WhiG family RNA polymerase sigma factor [Fimbriimonas sp.]